MDDYIGRTFCKDINCKVQEKIEEAEDENAKRDTKLNCYNKCGAYHFHHWLKNHSYRIIKEE